MRYTAIMNTPGYLPWSDDEPPVFDTAGEAWAYLAEQRREQEEITGDEVPSVTIAQLEACAAIGEPDVIYGGTPGYEGSHDLGIAYSVTETDRDPATRNADGDAYADTDVSGIFPDVT